MGADQIGYLLIGPSKLSAAKLAKAARLIEKINKEIRNYKDGDKVSSDVKYFLEARTGDTIEAVVDCDYLEGILEEPDDLISEIKAAWAGSYRDVAARDIGGGKRIFYAGGMSWGDTPDGAGYEAMDAAYAYGVLDIIGID
jgi:hypothetical protein